jgi:MEKHLA domain-containing protein/uncharacterized protein DUF3565
VALFDCGHRQHIRHHPPWRERPWVLSADGRASRLGTSINCVDCASGVPAPQVRWPQAIWSSPAVREWTALLLESYRHWTGRDLIPRLGTAEEQATGLFFAPVVVVSHGTEGDPIVNYGNRVALELWEADWSQLTRTPSRLTAEPLERAERERMLAKAAQDGFIADYRGVRISLTGKRFMVEDAIVWNILDRNEAVCGQAATFSTWRVMTEGQGSSRGRKG